ncbi:MAG: hypothetical protein A2381_16305 [Bdellovibrionales bacterium RIFOXYB1_FULL_37_110]|nr:MAG: hypothetical protein A2181_06410 [Bdellovibrionales bacterium RIFOXYA1_FULL_38_20]OFZ48504.1 MAG: hypothetical protein A2417_04165 [Bdellovibrionales bacterium RIFOXYC1_FULL_37_79]OFZ57183.1 MAG: hypothetical protein A2381_16305 [Bdellovibrionales bacterium RIFOXYB1_FULL_37_110]OFZ63162.1 MAG: hypothetical protein A2577_15805 [Bdellovibrionales bacterium RIFOXYD1_FULL_36_51]
MRMFLALCIASGVCLNIMASSDIQVLQAWYGNGINSGFGFGSDNRSQLKLDYSECEIVESYSSNHYLTQKRDCTETLKKIALLDENSSQESPMLGRFEVETFSYLNSSSVQSSIFGCSTVELRTVMAKEIVEATNFDGIGFYFNGSQTYVPKSELHVVGETTLKDGRSALVHRFIGTDLCKRSGASHYSSQVTSFNVYVAYQGNIKNWELSNRNHEIGYANGNNTFNGSGWGNIGRNIPMSFDRQDELLKK